MTQSKREKLLREGIDCVTIIESAIEWLDEKLKTDIPETYRHMSPTPVTSDMKRDNQTIRESLERQLGRCMAEPERGMFERIMKAKCDRRNNG